MLIEVNSTNAEFATRLAETAAVHISLVCLMVCLDNVYEFSYCLLNFRDLYHVYNYHGQKSQLTYC